MRDFVSRGGRAWRVEGGSAEDSMPPIPPIRESSVKCEEIK